MNKPTLILKPRGAYELNSSHSEFFDLMLEAKIMHEDFQSAADHLEAIIANPGMGGAAKKSARLATISSRKNFVGEMRSTHI